MSIEFSVVVPLHNKATHVVRCLSSVLAQPETAEVLVVDDASTDGGADIVRSMADKRICLLSRTTPGPGGYAARNLGAARATHPWLAFIDADDEWLPGHLGRLSHRIEADATTCLLGCAFLDARPGRPPCVDDHGRRFHRLGDHVISPQEYVRRSISGCCPLHTSGVAVRADALAAAGGFPEGRVTRGGDQETWLRLVLAGNAIHWCAEPGSVYHRDAENMVTNRTPPQLEDNAIAAAVRRELAGDPRLPGLLLRKLSNRKILEAMRHRFLSGQLRLRDLKHLYLATSPIMALTTACAAIVPGPICRKLASCLGRS